MISVPSCNNRSSVRSDIICWVHPEDVSGGPMRGKKVCLETKEFNELNSSSEAGSLRQLYLTEVWKVEESSLL